MSKRKESAIRQAYRKEYKRIDKVLLKLRKEGYDITQLSLPPKEPKRVTKTALQSLTELTPKRLRATLTYTGYNVPKGTPLRTNGQFTTESQAWERRARIRAEKQTIQPSVTKPINTKNLEWLERNGYYNAPQAVPEPSYGYYDEDITDSDRAEFQQEDTSEEPQEEPKQVETYPSMEGNEVVYRNIETGEEVERSPLAIETTDGEIIYYDAWTGEVIKTELNTWGYEGYDATELALDSFRGIIDSLPASMAKHFEALINRLIDTFGENGTGEAIQSWETKNGKSILEMLQSSNDPYQEIINTFSEIIEILPFTDEERESLRVEFNIHEAYEDIT